MLIVLMCRLTQIVVFAVFLLDWLEWREAGRSSVGNGVTIGVSAIAERAGGLQQIGELVTL